MRSFEVFPAIDLRGGRVVRLRQGDPRRETMYAEDPTDVASLWAQKGAQWLHVVNLDGAFGEESGANLAALQRILSQVAVKVQLGGGIRDMTSLQSALELGVARVVIGTAFIEAPEFVAMALARFGPDHLVLGIDARDGVVHARGWRSSTGLLAIDLAQRWATMGGRWVVHTDIARDGMGTGVNVKASAGLASISHLQVIASGGVRTLQDVRDARDAGLAGVIIGRALYEGQVDLAAALAVAQVSEGEDAG